MPSCFLPPPSVASLRERQGRLREAEALLKGCLAAQLRLLGEEHPDTRTSASTLECVQLQLQQQQELEQHQEQHQELHQKLHQEQHQGQHQEKEGQYKHQEQQEEQQKQQQGQEQMQEQQQQNEELQQEQDQELSGCGGEAGDASARGGASSGPSEEGHLDTKTSGNALKGAIPTRDASAGEEKEGEDRRGLAASPRPIKRRK